MGKFESTDNYPWIRGKATTYLPYIDDIFFSGKEERGATIIHRIIEQKKHSSIKFIFNYSKMEIEFLDTEALTVNFIQPFMANQ